MPVLFLLALFVVVPIVEIYVIIQVGEAIGVLPTIALLIADSIVGTVLMKSQGRAAWRRFRLALAEGRMPAREVVDGVLVIFGGALLLAPGFCTDVFGALLLLPPTRAVLRRVLVRRFTFSLLADVGSPLRPGAARRRPAPGGGPGRPAGGFDVEGTAHEIDDDPRRLP